MRTAPRLTVITWHNLTPTPFFPSAAGAAERGFVRQLGLLARRANVVPLDGALADLAEGRPLPPRAVALTFDDGYRSQLHVGARALARHALPGTFFLVTDYLDGRDEPWWERVAVVVAATRATRLPWRGSVHELDGPAARLRAARAITEGLKQVDHDARGAAIGELSTRLEVDATDAPVVEMLDWDGARELVRLGASVGSHSSHHHILARESEEQQRADLATSRARLEDELAVPVTALAYPNGTRADYDDATRRCATRAGFRWACTTVAGWNGPTTDPTEVRRFVVDPEIGRAALAGIVARRVDQLVARGGPEELGPPIAWTAHRVAVRSGRATRRALASTAAGR